MKRLSLDVTNALVQACGERAGVRIDDLRELIPKIDTSLAQLKACCGNEDGFFLDLPTSPIDEEQVLAKELQKNFDNLVVIGIGGSSLGTRAIYRGLRRPHSDRFRDGRPRGEALRLFFIENVDPIEIEDLLESLDLERTAFNVVTKSGTTIETISAMLIVRERLIDAFGHEGYRERMVCTTGPEKNALRKLAEEEKLRIFNIPPGVGGRYSALSAVGTLPLLCAGVDVPALLKGARAGRDNALSADLESNVAALFAAIQASFIERGTGDVVFMAYIPQFADLGEWFVQLWAESLGKTREDGSSVGPTPIPAIGARDQHSLLQLMMEGPLERNVVFVEDEQMPSTVRVPPTPPALESLKHLGERALSETLHAEQRGVEAALREAGRPSSTLRLHGVNEETLGAFVITLEVATALTGLLLDINPFDQPGVELGKRYAHGILGHRAQGEYLERLNKADAKLTRRVLSF